MKNSKNSTSTLLKIVRSLHIINQNKNNIRITHICTKINHGNEFKSKYDKGAFYNNRMKPQGLKGHN